MNNAKLIATHSCVGGAPKIISVLASDSIDIPRVLRGAGAPSATTLGTGNAKYNGMTGGFVVSAGIVAAGTGYQAGDILTAQGGTGTKLQITVDAVVAGAITDWHVSTAGNYSAYPANPVMTTVASGAGTGATLNLNLPPPDLYFDVSTPATPVLYACVTKGSKSTSTWAQVSGAGGGLTYYAITARSQADYITCQEVTSIINSAGVAVAHAYSGVDVIIAKQQTMRRSIINENYDGVMYTYGTPTGGDIDNIRTSTDGTTQQTEYPYPRYRTKSEVISDGQYAGYGGDLPLWAQCFILAEPVARTSGVIYGSVNFTTLVESAPPRVWCAA
jgi:hypothetical protein